MSLTDMSVFNDFMYTTITETIDQQIDAFNQASRGAILLRSARNVGDYMDEAFYNAFSTQSRRRDPNATGAVAAQDLAQSTMTKVKVGGANGPFAFDPGQFTWLQRNPEEAAVVIGEQVAMAIMQDYLNTGVGAARAAIVNNALAYDGTAGTLTLNSLNKGAALFGDKSADIVAWVVHSKAYHDLIDAGLTNTNRLFEFGTVSILQDWIGRPIIVSDVPELLISGTPDEYQAVGLVSGGIVVEDNGDFFANTETTNGDENINRTWQAEYSYNLGIKGYSWDKVNGGAAPTDVELFTGTNWDKVASYDKETAGVVVRTD
jgi:hypothetical protein